MSTSSSWFQQLLLVAIMLPIHALRGAASHDSASSSWEARCFVSTEELRDAVRQYQGQYAFDEELADKYGWPMNNWCVSNLWDFSNLFLNWDRSHYNTTTKEHLHFNEPLNKWDMSLARDLSGMFQNCHNFDQDLSTWDVSEVTSMSRMFASAKSFQHDLSRWDTSQLRDASYMFLHAHSFRGHQQLNAWDIRSLQTTEGMLRDAREFDSDQLHWDLTRIPSTDRMFSDVAGVSVVASKTMLPQNITQPPASSTGMTRQPDQQQQQQQQQHPGLRMDPAKIHTLLHP